MNETGVDTIILDETILDHDLKCESTHSHPLNRVCTEEVSVRAINCKRSFMACNGYTNYHFLAKASQGICLDCGRFVADCWGVVPV